MSNAKFDWALVHYVDYHSDKVFLIAIVHATYMEYNIQALYSVVQLVLYNTVVIRSASSGAMIFKIYLVVQEYIKICSGKNISPWTDIFCW